MNLRSLCSRSSRELARPIGRLAALFAAAFSFALNAAPIRVVVWDEQQPAQKTVYPNFIGNEIASYLERQKGIAVVSKRLDEPGQGVDKTTLDNCDVLIWWGHVRHTDLKPEAAKDIAQRVKSGQLSLLALHSAHWSAPFMEVMAERAREDALKALRPEERATAIIHETNQYPALRAMPKFTDRLTPDTQFVKVPGQPVHITLALPNCCFIAVRGDGKPSQMRVLLPDHPIAKGLPREFTLDQTEMYGEPFHVPTPDAVVLDERWGPGEWFRSGAVWSVGKGKVFYFRPGHETFPIYKNPVALKVIENTVRWMGKGK